MVGQAIIRTVFLDARGDRGVWIEECAAARQGGGEKGQRKEAS